jgi:CRISPR-associated exonuclease Cas4
MIFKITDFKQYAYCPRIIYYEYCFPVTKKTTAKMEIGRDCHDIAERLEKRRILKKYRIDRGESFFEKYLYSDNIGLSGKIDRVIKSEEKYYPVDYKNTSGIVHKNHILQLTGYALLIEEVYRTTVDRGFIFLLLSNKVVEININDDMKKSVKNIISSMNNIIESEILPDKTVNVNKCLDCEYRRFCNDIE